ncbi:MAG: tyrosine phosphatase family protein [Pseudochelatococcus sp.]|uniref:tyrosine phosphatase family protein n=1 Tax=Pseudochelatococcus sp. TaxID=2020869 RepID=UPI003D90DE8B
MDSVIHVAPAIHVTPLSRLSETLRRSQADHLVTMRSPGRDVPEAALPAGRPRHVLELVFHDIAEPRPGLVAPAESDVAALLDFACRRAGRGPLAINCYAGISRSPAAAFIVAAMAWPGRDEAELAAALRRRAPAATPNPRLVALADALLGRGGRMVAAIRAIGRGADAFEGEPFALPLPALHQPPGLWRTG